MSNRKGPKPVFLVDKRAQKAAIDLLLDQPLDGTMKIVISGAKDKSTRQRGLQWMGYTDVVKSGLGGIDEASETRLHLASKYRWCLPIQIRDDDHFAGLWMDFYNKWKSRPFEEKQRAFEWFVDNHVSTEALNRAQMAEYLTKFRDHYGHEVGVNLRDPDEFGWRNLLEYEKKH